MRKAKIDIWWLIAYVVQHVGLWLSDVYVWACSKYVKKHFGAEFEPDPEFLFEGAFQFDRKAIVGHSRLWSVGIHAYKIPAEEEADS
ncbi:MAG: hypothetical protein DRO01_07165 [Thermoproteota archaeon]|nr:MAG: hypothetical protein DRO01_07165 [Candidatus Korarchaeota archaeon]